MSLLANNVFNGTTYPTLHLIHFKLSMMSTSETERHNDAIMYKVFPRSLNGVALIWFGKLDLNTYSYASLVKIFITHFTRWSKY